MKDEQEYVPIPVDAAREIAGRYAKSVVIIAAWDPIHNTLHTTTYGDSKQDKAWAADGGEIVAKALGTMPEVATFFENYRAHCCLSAPHVIEDRERGCRFCGAPLVECHVANYLSIGDTVERVQVFGACCDACKRDAKPTSEKHGIGRDISTHPWLKCVAHPQPDRANGVKA